MIMFVYCTNGCKLFDFQPSTDNYYTGLGFLFKRKGVTYTYTCKCMYAALLRQFEKKA